MTEKKKRKDTGVRTHHKSFREKSKDYYEKYLARDAQMHNVFAQSLKIVQELLSRIEREMFQGMQYKAEEDPEFSNFDPQLTKSAEGMGKLVAQLQSIHLRMLKEGEKQAKNMSREEKVKQAIRFINKLPLAERKRVKADVKWE